MGINFGGYQFSAPAPLVSWTAPRCQGLYVVMVKDRTWEPLPARPIYFGESGNMSRRGFPFNHHAADAWFNVGGGALLWVSYLPTWGWTEAERRAVETCLVDHYATPCNARVRLHEQDPIARALWAGVGRFGL